MPERTQLSCLGHNVEGLVTHFADLVKMNNEHSPDVILLAETWLNPNVATRSIDIPRYVLYRSDREPAETNLVRGGTAIYCKTTEYIKHSVFWFESVEIE